METVIDRTALDAAIAELHSLESNLGNNEEPPSQQAVARAEEWVADLYREIADSGSRWIAPHIAASPDGEIVLEWWLGEKDLTVFVSSNSTTFLVSWGTDVISEMADGDINPPGVRRLAWRWLTS